MTTLTTLFTLLGDDIINTDRTGLTRSSLHSGHSYVAKLDHILSRKWLNFYNVCTDCSFADLLGDVFTISTAIFPFSPFLDSAVFFWQTKFRRAQLNHHKQENQHLDLAFKKC